MNADRKTSASLLPCVPSSVPAALTRCGGGEDTPSYVQFAHQQKVADARQRETPRHHQPLQSRPAVLAVAAVVVASAVASAVAVH